MASFPTSVFNPTARSNGQTIDASHINDLQNEVNAIEDGYINGTAPLNSSRSTLATLSVTGNSTLAAVQAGASTLASLVVSGNSTLAAVQAGASTVTSLSVTGGSTVNTLNVTGNSTLQAVNIQGTCNLQDAILQRPYLQDYAEVQSTLSDAGSTTVTVNFENGNACDVSYSSNITLAFSNPPVTGRVGAVTVMLRSNGSSWTVTLPGTARTAGNATYDASSSVDILTVFTNDAGSTYFVATAQDFR